MRKRYTGERRFLSVALGALLFRCHGDCWRNQSWTAERNRQHPASKRAGILRPISPLDRARTCTHIPALQCHVDTRYFFGCADGGSNPFSRRYTESVA